MSSKYKGFFESSLKKETQSKERRLTFDEKHRLPKDIKSRETIEKGFKDYLSDKQKRDEENFERRYISPPFEVSRVPSPVYGYNKRPKETKQDIDYEKLKSDMLKKENEFILFESQDYHDDQTIKKPIEKEIPEEIAQAEKKAKPTLKKSYGLHRTLESIIEEEKSGNNGDKSEVPGLFLSNNSGKERWNTDDSS